uniref:Uncharacterized protein n=1 Tax=Anguilla anguilla TaxID=7936 RepID=A0A0E9P853_ANGAN
MSVASRLLSMGIIKMQVQFRSNKSSLSNPPFLE